MAPNEPWQNRPMEGERGKKQIGEKLEVKKRSSTEVGLCLSPTCEGGVTTNDNLQRTGKIQDFSILSSPHL